MEPNMRKASAFVVGILEGMASPSRIFSPVSYPKLTGTDMDRLRGDVKNVGADFRRVIQREHGKASKQK
jgi:hypothetical protein